MHVKGRGAGRRERARERERGEREGEGERERGGGGTKRVQSFYPLVPRKFPACRIGSFSVFLL